MVRIELGLCSKLDMHTLGTGDCGGNVTVGIVGEPSWQPPSSRGAQELPVGCTALEPYVSCPDPCCCSTGGKGLGESSARASALQ